MLLFSLPQKNKLVCLTNTTFQFKRKMQRLKHY